MGIEPTSEAWEARNELQTRWIRPQMENEWKIKRGFELWSVAQQRRRVFACKIKLRNSYGCQAVHRTLSA
jgi:hypothetical protein